MSNLAPEVEAVIQFARIGMRVFSERALSWVGLAGAMVLFGYAAAQPDWIRVAGSVAYSLLVFWPLLRFELTRTKE